MKTRWLMILSLTVLASGCTIKHKRASDPEVVISHYKQNLEGARSCYEDVIAQSPELEGDVSLQWTVNDKGEVVKPEIVESTLNSPEVHSCLLSHLKMLDFPPTPRFSKSTVTYTFHFTSLRSSVAN